MSKPHILLLIAISLTLSACGGTGAFSSGGGASTTAERTDRSDIREDRSGNERVDRSEDRRARGGQGDRETGSAVLELSGDDGTAFSGACTIGEEEIQLEGTVPKSLELDLNGEPLRCEIENTGTGALKADLMVGNSHYIQQTTSQGSTLNFALSGGGYSSSTSSVTTIQSNTADAVSNVSSHAEAGVSSHAEAGVSSHAEAGVSSGE